jgi:CDP-glucose 4,6-dehydratase
VKNDVGAVLRSLPGPVLITGHTGFKGTWLVRYLEQIGVEVCGFSLPLPEGSLYSRAQTKKTINEKFGDIRNIKEFDDFVNHVNPSVIIHLAAQSLVLESYQDPIGTFATNVIGTANVLETARCHESVRAVGVITTDKVYENRNTGRRFVESDSILGLDPYSASKAGAENVVTAWRNLVPENSQLNISVFRAGNVIGGGDIAQNRLIPDIVRAWENNTEVLIRNPMSTRPWQHVLDPLRGYVMALEDSIQNGKDHTLNFGPSEISMTVETVVEEVKKFWPELIIRQITGEQNEYESTLLDLDSNEAQSLLNWLPIYTQKQSIQKTLEWWTCVKIEKRSVEDSIDTQIIDFIKAYS